MLIAKTDGRVDGANAREFQKALEAAIDASDRAIILDIERLIRSGQAPMAGA
jgi:anti-anti-sigma regulatory factor